MKWHLIITDETPGEVAFKKIKDNIDKINESVDLRLVSFNSDTVIAESNNQAKEVSAAIYDATGIDVTV